MHFNKYSVTLLSFFELLKIVLINMLINLMMPAKLATVGLLKIKVFWNKGYEVLISIYDVTNIFFFFATQIILQM